MLAASEEAMSELQAKDSTISEQLSDAVSREEALNQQLLASEQALKQHAAASEETLRQHVAASGEVSALQAKGLLCAEQLRNSTAREKTLKGQLAVSREAHKSLKE